MQTEWNLHFTYNHWKVAIYFFEKITWLFFSNPHISRVCQIYQLILQMIHEDYKFNQLYIDNYFLFIAFFVVFVSFSCVELKICRAN